MIRAYILIELANGKEYKYVRDVVDDTLGINKVHYGYRGNGYQSLGVSIPGEMKFTSLVWDTTYYFTVNVDLGGAVEYSIKFPSPSSKFGVPNTGAGQVRWFELVDKLSSVGQGTFEVDIIDNDIRIISMGNTDATSIAITAGATGTDLLAALDVTPPAAITSDNLKNQTGAGKILGDFNSILTDLNTDVPPMLGFPESGGDTGELTRDNYSNGIDDRTITTVMFRKDKVATLKIVEEKVEGLVNTI